MGNKRKKDNIHMICTGIKKAPFTMNTLYIKLVLFFFSMSIASYAQISVFDIVEDAKKERGDATDAAEVEADAKAMEGMQEFFSETTGMKDTGDKPMAGRCLDV